MKRQTVLWLRSKRRTRKRICLSATLC